MRIMVSIRIAMPLLLITCGAATLPARADDRALPVDFRSIVADAKDRVFPAVIYIKCIRESHESGKKQSQAVSGSGVIISETGEALTNWHVVDKAREVRCLLSDGRAFYAKIVGTDKDTDVAMIQLELKGDEKVPFATLGDSSRLQEGDFVMAMGAPWGMNRSVTIGIVSCTKRYLPESSEYSRWIQTDASISPGNSGGPLIDTTGEVVGLNTRATMVGGDLGFTVPVETIRILLPHLREHGVVKWSWSGLQLQALRDFDRNMYFDATEGVIVGGTDPDSPARRAGLKLKDRIVAINGESITAMTVEDLPDVRRRFGLVPKNEPMTLSVWRGDEALTIDVTPREKGKVEGEELDCPRWDLTVKAINQFDNPDLYFHRKEGVFIYGIKYPGNASNSGLSEKDIVLKIGKNKVASLDDVRRIHKELIGNVASKHKVAVTVLRNGLMRQCILDFSRDYEKE